MNDKTAETRHAAYIKMLRRMVAAGINDSTVSPARLAEAEAEYERRYGKKARLLTNVVG